MIIPTIAAYYPHTFEDMGRIILAMTQIRYVVVHHFGAVRPEQSTAHLTRKQINDHHRQNWPDFPSKLDPNDYIGYNIIVWPDGSFTQHRGVGDETAAQKGHNKDAISICLAGNFSPQCVDVPNYFQEKTVAELVLAAQKGPSALRMMGVTVREGVTIDIPDYNIIPHRVAQPHHTECNGMKLKDNWARVLVMKKRNVPPPDPISEEPHTPPLSVSEQLGILQKMLLIAMAALDFLRRKTTPETFGAGDRECTLIDNI